MSEDCSERVAREDLALFINAAFVCSGQSEFYGDADGQAVAIDFLHQYILINYRRLYARTLAANINHFNAALVIVNLLATGKDTLPEDRVEEGNILTMAIRRMPIQRVLRLFSRLRDQKVNNRRTRAVIRDYIAQQNDVPFIAVKYRRRLRSAARHAHLDVAPEVGRFLFEGYNHSFTTPIFDSFRRAHFSQNAVYELPYSIAEGFAAKHKIDQGEFLKMIAPRMTTAEKRRLQRASAKANATIPLDLGRVPLTALALYICSLSMEHLSHEQRISRVAEFELALQESAKRAFERAPIKLSRVAAILDRSYSSSGSLTTRNRPLAVAMGASALLRCAASDYQAFWTPKLRTSEFGTSKVDTSEFGTSKVGTSKVGTSKVGTSEFGTSKVGTSKVGTSKLNTSELGASKFGTVEHEVCARSTGQTDIASPLLSALEWDADLIVIVSDGHENDPPGATTQLLKAYRNGFRRSRPLSVVHLNPVFDSQHYAPRSIGEGIPTLGLRHAEDLLTQLAFAQFAEGSAELSELEQFLESRVTELVQSI